MGALFLSVALNVVLVKHYNLIDKLIIRNTDLYASYNTVYYRGFVSMFNEIDYPSNVDVLFLGDSLTERADFNSMLPGLCVVEMGIGSDTTVGLYNRIDVATKIQPRYIFIEIGINDLEHRIDVDDILENYKKILDYLSLNCKDSVLVVEGVYPVSSSIEGSIDYPRTNAEIDLFNSRLRTMVNEIEGILFLDLDGYLKNGKSLNDLYTFDGLHLNGLGYKKVVEAFYTILER